MNLLPPLLQNLSTILSTATGEYTLALRHTDLSGPGLPYLLAVCQHPGLSQEALSRHLSVDKSNVTRQLEKLERAGYITRTHGGTDRRSLTVHPTDRAFELLPTLAEVVGDCRGELTRGMSPEEVELFCELAERMAHNARRLEAQRARGEAD